MKIKWFEIFILVSIIVAISIFSINRKTQLKTKLTQIEKKGIEVNDILSDFPIGKDLTNHKVEDLSKIYRQELKYIKKSLKDPSLKTVSDPQLNVRIGILQGQLNDLKKQLEVLTESIIPWWLNIVIAIVGWIVAHLFQPITLEIGERFKRYLFRVQADVS